ncbi:hypothetical protein DITRI_Ditri13aG0028800 [Diplodiscus trichospermus]
MARGTGMLLINNEHQGEEILTQAHILPASALRALDGKAIERYMNSTNSPTTLIVLKGTTYVNRAPIVAAYSSKGPTIGSITNYDRPK